MQPEGDARLGAPPEARHPQSGNGKPPRMALGLTLALIAACALVAGVLPWLFGNAPGSS